MRSEGLLLMLPEALRQLHAATVSVHARSGDIGYGVGFFEDAFFSASSSGGGKDLPRCWGVITNEDYVPGRRQSNADSLRKSGRVGSSTQDLLLDSGGVEIDCECF